MSTLALAIWCRVFQSRDVRSRVFSRPGLVCERDIWKHAKFCQWQLFPMSRRICNVILKIDRYTASDVVLPCHLKTPRFFWNFKKIFQNIFSNTGRRLPLYSASFHLYVSHKKHTGWATWIINGRQGPARQYNALHRCPANNNAITILSPEHIVSAPTLQSFRRHLKTILLQQSFCLAL